jgi:tetratricopeptide (TPR) repeat protein
LVLTGVWDSVVDGLELQATLEDAQTETIVHAFDPIPASPESPDEAIATLRDWTLIAAQDHLHPVLAFGAGDRLPKYEAYQEYRGWFETMGSGRWQNAIEIDPDFIRARFLPTFANAEYGRLDFAQGILSPIEGDGRWDERLTVSQTHLANALRSHLDRRWDDALGELEWIIDNGQDNWVSRFMAMVYALRSNRPIRSLEHFEALGPPPLGLRNLESYALNGAADACHILGRYEQELEFARRRKAADRYRGAMREARALVALGRLDEVDALVSEVFAQANPGSIDPGNFMFQTAVFLRVHGHKEESIALAERAAEWHRTTSLVEFESDVCQTCLADSLRLAGKFEEAMAIYREKERKDPSDPRAILMIAVIAAQMGDRLTAEQMTAQFDDIDEWDLGTKLANKAWVAEELGDCDESMRLLREAAGSGLGDWIDIHTFQADDCFVDNPDFEALIRPKG